MIALGCVAVSVLKVLDALLVLACRCVNGTKTLLSHVFVLVLFV